MESNLNRESRRFPVLMFLGLTFLITWGCVFYLAAGEVGLLSYKPSQLWLALLGQFGPLWAALFCVGLMSGPGALKPLLKRALPVGLDRGAWGVLLVLLPLQFALAYGGFALFHGGRLDFSKVQAGQAVGGLLVGTLIGLVFGGLSEEVGWRGYLLPRLQGRLHPLVAGAVVGLVWSLWHLDPEVLAVAAKQGWGPFWAGWARYQSRYLLETIPFAMFLAVFYNRTRGSLFAVMAAHALSNAAVVAFWSSMGPLPGAFKAWDAAVWVALAILLDRVWKPWGIQAEGASPD